MTVYCNALYSKFSLTAFEISKKRLRKVSGITSTTHVQHYMGDNLR